MKKLLIAVLLTSTSTAFAQKNRNTPPQTYSSNQKVFGGNIGMSQSALNVGISMDAGADSGDIGGSFFLQTEKKDNNVVTVYQVMTFGGHVHLRIFDQAGWVVGLRPGVNVTMINDVPNKTGGKSNKTIFGPTLRWSIAHRLNSGFEIGFEQLEITNWFDGDVAKSDSYTTLVFRTRF